MLKKIVKKTQLNIDDLLINTQYEGSVTLTLNPKRANPAVEM